AQASSEPMPIEPQLFLSYGRPDSELALAVTAELWRNRIECYNYQVKPIMDHYGFDQDHLKYLASIKLLVAIVTAESQERELVVHCQKAWDINKQLYAEPWRKNDATFNPAATTVPLPFAHDIVGEVLRGCSMQQFLAGDLARLFDVNNRWILLLMLQRVTSR